MPQPTPPPFTPPKSTEPTSTSSHTPTGQPLPPHDHATPSRNNPFTHAVNGIKAIFKYARPVAILLVLFSLAGVIANLSTMAPGSSTGEASNQETAQMTLEDIGVDLTSSEEGSALIGVAIFFGIIAFIVVILALVISALINGMSDVAAAAASGKKTLTLGQTFKTLFKRFPGYLWLTFLVGIKVFLWSLLFIVPGIIMAVRYSLAGVAFFARDMKASEAIRYSTKITKNGWMTLFASNAIFNAVTLFTLQSLTQAGVKAAIFEQYNHYATTNTSKPRAHWLSILATVLFFALISLGIVILPAAIFVGLTSYY